MCRRPVGGCTEEPRQIPLGAFDPASQYVDADLEGGNGVPLRVDRQPDDAAVPFGEHFGDAFVADRFYGGATASVARPLPVMPGTAGGGTRS